jgi:hypothetical protein
VEETNERHTHVRGGVGHRLAPRLNTATKEDCDMLCTLKRTILVTALVAVAGAAAADWGPWSLSFDSDAYSKYIWRGWNYADHGVYQPSVTIGYEPFSVNVWGNYDSGETGKWDEVDYTFDYTNPGNDYSWSVGHIWYTSPQEKTLTGEAYLSVTVNQAPWSPTLSYFHDYDEGDGGYALLSFNTEVPVGGDMPWQFGLGVGYNMHQWRDECGFSDCTACLSIPVKLWKKGPVIVPTLAYSKSLDTSYFEDEFYAGVSVPVLGW